MTFIPYESRKKAGEILVDFVLGKSNRLSSLLLKNQNGFFVFAIPNGGVPVAEGFCKKLNLKYDMLVVRKLKIPYNPEAGFGAITTDDTVLFNERLLSQLSLSKEQVDRSIAVTKSEIQDRITFYKKEHITEQNYHDRINNKCIFLIDDGLASGFTMLAAIKMIIKYNPKKTYICVPTAPLHTIESLKNHVDEIFCPNIKKTTWFAVADAYKHWYDVPETEVVKIIASSKYYIGNF